MNNTFKVLFICTILEVCLYNVNMCQRRTDPFEYHGIFGLCESLCAQVFSSMALHLHIIVVINNYRL